MRYYPLYASLLLLISTHAYAAAPMTLTPNTSSIQIRSDGAGVAAYTLTNTSRATLSDITIFPDPSGLAAAELSVQNNSCTSSLVASASCQFQILITGIDLGTNFSLSPKVCALNNTVCAVATSSNRPSVTVVPVTHPVTAYMALASGSDENSILPINTTTQAPGTLIPGFDFTGIITTSSDTKTQMTSSTSVGMAIAPNGSMVYVPNPGNGMVSFVNVATSPAQVSNVLIPNAPASMSATSRTQISHAVPTAVVATPNNQSLYVYDSQGPQVVVMNIPNETVVSTILFMASSDRAKTGCLMHANRATTNSPAINYGMAISPNGATVYLPIGANVAAIQTSDNTVTYLDCADLNNPWGIAVAPDNSVVYITNSDGNTVSVVDTTNYAHITSINVGCGPTGIAVSPDGNTVYVANTSENTISVIDANANIVTNTINLDGSQPYGVAVSPDGSQLYVDYIDSDIASVIDTTTFEAQDVSLPGVSASFGPFVG